MISWSRKTTEAMKKGIRPKWVNWALPTLVAASFLTATDCLWVKARYCNLLAGRMIYFQCLLRMEKFFQSYSKYHCFSLLLYRQWSVD